MLSDRSVTAILVGMVFVLLGAAFVAGNMSHKAEMEKLRLIFECTESRRG